MAELGTTVSRGRISQHDHQCEVKPPSFDLVFAAFEQLDHALKHGGSDGRSIYVQGGDLCARSGARWLLRHGFANWNARGWYLRFRETKAREVYREWCECRDSRPGLRHDPEDDKP